MPARKAKKVPPSGEEETMEDEEQAELSDDFRPGRAGRIEPVVEGDDDFGEGDDDVDEVVIESDTEEEEEAGEEAGGGKSRARRQPARKRAVSRRTASGAAKAGSKGPRRKAAGK